MKISNQICQYCKEKYGEKKSIDGLDTHGVCNNKKCQERLNKEWD